MRHHGCNACCTPRGKFYSWIGHGRETTAHTIFLCTRFPHTSVPDVRHLCLWFLVEFPRPYRLLVRTAARLRCHTAHHSLRFGHFTPRVLPPTSSLDLPTFCIRVPVLRNTVLVVLFCGAWMLRALHTYRSAIGHTAHCCAFTLLDCTMRPHRTVLRAVVWVRHCCQDACRDGISFRSRAPARRTR